MVYAIPKRSAYIVSRKTADKIINSKPNSSAVTEIRQSAQKFIRNNLK